MQFEDPTLGTTLRHLIDLLDGDVQVVYKASGLDYRPRYTPVVKALASVSEPSIRAIATHAKMTHSAVSQTVAQMAAAGLVLQHFGADSRERIVRPTEQLTSMLPKLRALWANTNRAASELDEELTFPLSAILREAVLALERRPFRNRIRDAESSKC